MIYDLVLSHLPLAHAQSKQMWRVECDGETLIKATADPEHAACRALAEQGKTGSIRTRFAESAYPHMSMGIEWGAARATADPSKGHPHTHPYAPYSTR